MQDSNVEKVISKFRSRSEAGIKKYGATTDAAINQDWLRHLQEELMDAIIYIEAERNKHEWRPIETAPKTGATLILWNPQWAMNIARTYSGRWSYQAQAWYLSDASVAIQPQPTHWMPLPIPPSAVSSLPQSLGGGAE